MSGAVAVRPIGCPCGTAKGAEFAGGWATCRGCGASSEISAELPAHLVRLGCFVWLERGALFLFPELAAGGFDAADFVQVEGGSGETQEFLDAANEALGSAFTLEEFAGG